MSWLSDLFKKPKQNWTPDIMPQTPQASSPLAYGNLSKLSDNYINNRGTGFGEDYLNRTTSAPIAQIDANFRERTMPTISNEASRRGLARSSIVQDQIGQADLQRNRDIGTLVAQMYQLNEAQKKADQTLGAQIGQNLLTGDTAQHNVMAESSRMLRNQTNAGEAARTASNQQTLMQGLGAGAMMLGGPIGAGLGSSLGGALSSLGFGGLTKAIEPVGAALNQGLGIATGQTNMGVKTLNSIDDNMLNKLIMERQFAQKFGLR